ncbi:hypothetical protein B0A55_02949 [Friedmanniomyces simplex]|uniref:Uncharacterized protein n=1 Tax=Friedmanniomyces simplex TaxID=329884 RepID=A0A4U0XYV8_9PEZI|nr:hypothetical protein B0A55_02949 [Friedmanniomyces simplex]
MHTASTRPFHLLLQSFEPEHAPNTTSLPDRGYDTDDDSTARNGGREIPHRMRCGLKEVTEEFDPNLLPFGDRSSARVPAMPSRPFTFRPLLPSQGMYSMVPNPPNAPTPLHADNEAAMSHVPTSEDAETARSNSETIYAAARAGRVENGYRSVGVGVRCGDGTGGR